MQCNKDEQGQKNKMEKQGFNKVGIPRREVAMLLD